MARPIKYQTQEERQAARNANNRRWRLKKLEEQGRKISNPIKRVKIKREKDAIKIEIGTMDRTKLNTAYVEMFVGLEYNANYDLLFVIRDETTAAFKSWLYGQDMWDKHNYISLCDMPERGRGYKAKVKIVSFQFHVHRTEITDFDDTVENLTGLADKLVESVKKTCENTGLKLQAKLCPNPQYHEELAKRNEAYRKDSGA